MYVCMVNDSSRPTLFVDIREDYELCTCYTIADCLDEGVRPLFRSYHVEYFKAFNVSSPILSHNQQIQNHQTPVTFYYKGDFIVRIYRIIHRNKIFMNVRFFIIFLYYKYELNS